MTFNAIVNELRLYWNTTSGGTQRGHNSILIEKNELLINRCSAQYCSQITVCHFSNNVEETSPTRMIYTKKNYQEYSFRTIRRKKSTTETRVIGWFNQWYVMKHQNQSAVGRKDSETMALMKACTNSRKREQQSTTADLAQPRSWTRQWSTTFLPDNSNDALW